MHLSKTLTFHVLIACHNRREQTIRSIRSLRNAALGCDVRLKFWIFDDGSTDGTTESIMESEPNADVLNGDGTMFWARSMACVEAEALRSLDSRSTDERHLSYLLWLNDDVLVYEEALAKLIEEARKMPGTVFVGAVQDPSTMAVTYGGYVKSGFHPMRFTRQPLSRCWQQIDTFNGNFVLIPCDVASLLGGIDGNYSHSLADFDYGIRLKNLGVPMLLAPFFVGTCQRNLEPKGLSLMQKWNRWRGIKGGGNPASLKRFLRKLRPNTWFFHYCASNIFWWLRALTNPPSRLSRSK